jgi:hypothetical protein
MTSSGSTDVSRPGDPCMITSPWCRALIAAISVPMSPDRIVVFGQSARVSVRDATYFGIALSQSFSGLAGAVGQNAAQIW